MDAKHQHIAFESQKERAILIALILTGSYFIVEMIGGFLTKSLALISDAAHMLTDVTALIIAFIAIKMEKKPADNKRTFGYHRFEILAATLNTFLLFIAASYILYEAYLRISHPPNIQSIGMLVIALLGLIVNVISMRLLYAGKNQDLNFKSAYLEVWSDALGSIGVILGALAIQFLNWLWIDSTIGVLIGVWILPRTWSLLKMSVNVLLEGVPYGLDIHQIKQSMLMIEGLLEIHELHVWAISSNRINLTAHLVIDKKMPPEQCIATVNALLEKQFHISHTTLQIENKKCSTKSTSCYFNH